MSQGRPSLRIAHTTLGGLFGIALLISMGVESAQADLIFLKDGTVLQGVIKRESKLEVDPVTREPFTVPSGHYWADDGPRRIYFAQYLVGRVEKKIAPNEERIFYKHKDSIINPLPVTSMEVFDAPDFSDEWRRSLTVRVNGREGKLGQAMTIMTPHWSRADATKVFQWGGAYLTRELGLPQVRRLVGAHPDFQETPRMSETDKATRRFRYVDFFTQAGWYSEAELELQRILEDLPTQKEKAEAGLKVLRAIIARERFETIKRMHNAGMYELVHNRLNNFRNDYADEKIQADVLEMKADYKKTLEKVYDSRKLMGELVTAFKSDQAETLADAVRTIATDVHPGNLERLETFLGQARQWSRLRAQNQKPEASAEEVMALGITGWLLGSAAAENKVDSAVKLWKARALVLEVLRANSPAERAQLVNTYTEQPAKDQIPMDWFVQMIPHLPPAAPEDLQGANRFSLSVGDGRGTGSFLVQLPPEYRHSHSYPVLMVLHDAGEKAEDMLRRWSEAVDHGYILVAPQWDSTSGYQYSTQEHDLVMSVLREVRRRFNVDSDRVFLHGLGQGGTMAFDVGLSHPDQFAGLLPMSATPDYFCLRYWKNSLYLPMYVVTGERLGDLGKKTKGMFDALILNNYNALWVQYKGRGVEWYGGEVPLILDWMSSKKRSFSMWQLGNDDGSKGPKGEFQCMRPSDSKFYWLSSDFVLPRCLTTAQLFNPQTQAATFFGKVDPRENKIRIQATGLKQLSIWLGRNSKGETTIDFDKPVTVQVGLQVRIVNQMIKPSLGILLEDLALRGDRQQLFLARINLNF